MGFLARIFKRTSTIRTTHDRPFVIDAPKIGFLNLAGAAVEASIAADRDALAKMFSESLSGSNRVLQCHVLFVYATIDDAGNFQGSNLRLREVIKTAGAYLAVVATENPVESYIKATSPKNDWPANIVLTLNRNNEKFALFFSRLFTQMFEGKSMLMAWVDLAPQIPGRDQPDCPETIMAAEAGHITFGKLL
jgi:hypothetical protein